ncbi:SDR family oxidoreductase [Amycolatopsis regifaucium]|uniref:Short-chain dehydrogenase n=1 Tax=Amycolatopsis regifaucium TaxID=546365 RepID=A0A154MIK8_9PSEU|nr:SDR family oxidoreductase [Amycolatopsis regifaucium]KZB83817.1 short-chain dehydrogenase [Amycolatopsis regifaucium]OKA06740.1 short-chain dehydrogenase [Amycolatopsis regifaucium]SFH25675.1 NAD(P)-dependent dehydrogenase, short-chain alcohol dehydrogenase family [Amycolatopsis regifaucium]
MKSKILLVGATGTIGTAVSEALTARGHEVLPASRSGEIRVDVGQPATLDAVFDTEPGIGHVVCCAGSGSLVPVDGGTDEEFVQGLHGKLLGQVFLLRHAIPRLPDGGSVTVTAGRIPETLRGSAFGVLTNVGLEAFVAAAARELPRGLRVNAVSPGWVSETLAALGEPDGGTPAAEVARCYVEAVESANLTGRTLTP